MLCVHTIVGFEVSLYALFIGCLSGRRSRLRTMYCIPKSNVENDVLPEALSKSIQLDRHMIERLSFTLLHHSSKASRSIMHTSPRHATH
uniref:AlNc14C549G12126 protein n=1 Tax=Albugo laibachii Nc14 TaxID=890382 RepID=F0X134_9STRA|nr:AlNc14C549G12126 [Albugo laibachii Nc14]|eukprot:CCA27488.1 AlNc14C549G12126 [Albugo laibachii Nc14]